MVAVEAQNMEGLWVLLAPLAYISKTPVLAPSRLGCFFFCTRRLQGSGNKKWNGTGGLGSILDKSLEHCDRTALLQKICCYGEVPLKPYPLP